MQIFALLEKLYFLDFYKTVPEGKVVKSLSGAILSVVTLTIISLAIYIEIRDHDDSRIVSDIIPNSGDNLNIEENSLELYFSITFYHIPCAALEISSKNNLQEKTMKNNLVLTRVDNNGSQVGFYINNNHNPHKMIMNEIFVQFHAGEGCIVDMNLLKPSVKGNFVFTLKFYQDYDAISNVLQNIYEHFNFSHKINAFKIKNTFSYYLLFQIQNYINEKIKNKNVDNWNRPGILKHQNLTNETTIIQKENQSVIYFLQISHEKYFFDFSEFSPISYKKYKFYKNIREGIDLGIYFIYNISPYYIEYKLSKESISNLIIKIFSTFVGILVVSEIIETICYKIYTFMKNKNEFQKISISSI